jgi:hypothetical protein
MSLEALSATSFLLLMIVFVLISRIGIVPGDYETDEVVASFAEG